MNILVIDNYDSFIYNYVDSLRELGHAVEVVRNDVAIESITAKIAQLNCQCLVISPGPGKPEAAGACMQLIQELSGKLPIIGICLGHQALACSFDGVVTQDAVPVHGKRTGIKFDANHMLFSGINGSLSVGRYHSLKVSQLPPGFEVIAEADGIIMAMANDELGLLGMQFHPESILTTQGNRLIANSIDYAAAQYQQLNRGVSP